MIADHYIGDWGKRLPEIDQQSQPARGILPVTEQEIEQFRKLLERAKDYDRRTGQEDCELESKKQTLLKLAELLGVKIDFL